MLIAELQELHIKLNVGPGPIEPCDEPFVDPLRPIDLFLYMLCAKL